MSDKFKPEGPLAAARKPADGVSDVFLLLVGKKLRILGVKSAPVHLVHGEISVTKTAEQKMTIAPEPPVNVTPRTKL